MSDDKTNKNMLILLTEDGGWADDDVPEETEKKDAPPKPKVWESVAKPDVAPIGTDFEISGTDEKKDKRAPREPSTYNREYNREYNRGERREGGFRSDRGPREGGYRSDRGPREGGFRSDRGERREGGFRSDRGGRFGQRYGRSDEETSWRSDRGSVAPSTSRSEQPRNSAPKENPFGSATPIEVKSTSQTSDFQETTELKPKVTSDIFGGATPVVPKSNFEDKPSTSTPTIRKFDDKSRRQSDNPSFFGGRKDRKPYNNGFRSVGNKGGNKGGFQKVKPQSTRRTSPTTVTTKPTKTEFQKDDKTSTNSFALLEEI